jgi:membrane-bound serine protease (ClpP class)
MRRLGPPAFVLLALLACAPLARAQSRGPGRIEVVDVSGLIEANVERAMTKGLTLAEREHAKLLVFELNSKGTVGAHRAERIASKIEHSSVPVAAWVGPAGATASNGAAYIWSAADVPALAHGATTGPVRTLDLRGRTNAPRPDLKPALFADSVGDLIAGLNGHVVRNSIKLDVDPQVDSIRLHKMDLLGRALHAAAQPSITYLLVLLGLVGLLFEFFHPSTGPAGVTGAVAMALGVYGVIVLGGSWLGFGLIVAGVAAFCVDLRFQSLGAFTAAGFVALAAGSILLFHGPFLRISPAVIAAGVIGMTVFLVSAMTRVLRDLRMVASGQLQVRDAHEAVISDNGGGQVDHS